MSHNTDITVALSASVRFLETYLYKTAAFGTSIDAETRLKVMLPDSLQFSTPPSGGLGLGAAPAALKCDSSVFADTYERILRFN